MLIAVAVAVGLALTIEPTLAGAATLPDLRAYELVSNLGAAGEGALNGATPTLMAAAEDGEAVDWQAYGACCGAGTGGNNTYRSTRAANEWLTRAISPVPLQPLSVFELQEAVFTTEDLSQTIFLTPASYAPGDRRSQGSGGDDLYLQNQSGALEWLSQGPAGSGEGPYPTRFYAATPNVATVVFGSAEALTGNAAGLAPLSWAQYLYARDVQRERTVLVDVDDGGNPIGIYGATLGNAGPPSPTGLEARFYDAYHGSTTNAISQDGSKIFFETPAAGVEDLPQGVEPHLYMRDLANGTTTPLDDPAAAGSAQYEGAAANGALVFFTSNEGLDGAPAVNELYEFNTTSEQIGQVPPMSSVPVAAGAGVIGVTAISNDASHVFFLTKQALPASANPLGQAAVENQPNLYVYDTNTGETRFVSTLELTDVSSCKLTCASIEPAHLVDPADVDRPAYTTPNGSVLVFASNGDLTGETHTASTTLTYAADAGERMLTVGSTAGLYSGHTIEIGSGERAELYTIEKVDGPTELTLEELGPGDHQGLLEEHSQGSPVTAVNAEIYRYSLTENSLTCVSCTPPGVLESQGASLGDVAGGSYAPAGRSPQMSEDGSRIFFDSPDPLLPGMAAATTGEPNNLYEWENGKLYLIADASGGGAVFDGTTPSGDDAFFSTRRALTPAASPGYEHIYDARVNGGFPAEAPQAAGPCANEACVGLPEEALQPALPASVTLGEQHTANAAGRRPTFTVSKITTAQRSELARSGRLRFEVSATGPGGVRARMSTKLGARRVRVAHASAAIGSSGRLALTLSLESAARAELARRGALRLRLEVAYQLTGAVDVAEFTIDASDTRRPHTGRRTGRA